MMHAPLTGAQKCAVLLLLLDEPEAAEMLRRLASDEVHAVGHAMLSVAEIEPRAIDGVLDEFLAASNDVAALGGGGVQVRSVLERALGTRRAESVLDRLGPPVTSRRFAGLDWVEPAEIAAVLAAEHPQAAVVVLAHLPPERAAAVLAAMPAAAQPGLLHRLATLRPVAASALAELEAALEAQFAAAPAASAAAAAGPDFAARLLNLSPDQGRLLDALAAIDPDLGALIAEQLFLFDDLLKIDMRGMQALVAEIDPGVLVVALKGAAEPLRAHVFAAMSVRAAAQVQDDLAAAGPLKRSEVDAAQATIAGTVRRLADAGALMMPGSADGYV